MVKEIPLTQGKVALVDDEDYESIVSYQYKWHAEYSGGRWYVACSRKTIIPHTFRLHQFLMHPQPGQYVDHIDGNGLNCTRSNLRLCNGTQNQGNRRMDKRNKSGYKGVRWDARTQQWLVSIRSKNRTIHIGRFNNIVEAARAYDRKARELFGPFANTNFPA